MEENRSENYPCLVLSTELIRKFVHRKEIRVQASYFTFLTSLFVLLVCFRIRELNHLEPLQNLQRLYLGMNRIQVSFRLTLNVCCRG